jgi:hypothetical protein
MAVKQIADLYLNRQKRFTEALVATVPAKLNDGNKRLQTPAEFVQAADDYQMFVIPKNAIVKNFYLYVREAFNAGTTLTVTTVNGAQAVFTGADLATEGLLVSALVDLLNTEVDALNFKFSQDVTQGVVQVVADFVSIDEKSGKYTESAPLTV